MPTSLSSTDSGSAQTMAPMKAMKGHKRQAAHAKGGEAKRGKKDTIPLKCKLVAAAIDEADHLSGPCKEALAAAALPSLGVPVEERHAFQEKVVEHLGQALVTVEKAKADSLAAADLRVAGADAEKATRLAAEEAAKESAAAKAAECDEKKKLLEEATGAEKAQKAALASAQKDQKHLEKALKKAEHEKEKYTEAHGTSFKALSEGMYETAKDAKAYLHKVTPICKEMKLDTSLLTSLSSAVEKKKDSRGTFDDLVISQLGDALQARITGLTSEVEKAMAEYKEGADKAGAHEADFVAAETARKAAEEASGTARAEKKTLEKDLAEKSDSLESWEDDLREMIADRDEKARELEHFRTGPLATFAALKSRSTTPPPEPEPLPVDP